MSKIQRFLFTSLKEAIVTGGKVVVLYGPRQVVNEENWLDFVL